MHVVYTATPTHMLYEISAHAMHMHETKKH